MKQSWRKQTVSLCCVVAGPLVFAASTARGDETKPVREAVKYVIKKFGPEIGEETAETLSKKLTRLAASHGDEAIEAFRKVGPRTFKYVEEAGEQGPRVIKLMVREGENAVWVVSNPKRLAIFVQHGDDAATAMIKHKDIVLPLIERCKEPAAKAFKAVDGQSARRLAMMEDAGELAKLGRTEDVLTVVGRYGDSAADFVWRNKGALATAAALSAFLADPQPFIAGTRDLAQVVGDVVKEPIREVARGTNWTLIVLAAFCLLAAIIILRWKRYLFGRAARRAIDSSP